MSEMRFDTYYAYDDLTRHLHALAALRPDLVSVESIGASFENRNIWCATVTNSATGPADEKPAFWIDGNIHATEVSASTACLYFLHKLITQYGIDEQITRCLDTRAFYIVPRLNPDGPELYFAANPRAVRSSVRPYPFDEEPIEGLRPADIDGDGRVLSMRIADPLGAWKEHAEDPRVMVRRDADELGGRYFRLLPEGLIENYDGVTLTVQRSKEGLDLNRNYPIEWRTEGDQHGAGPFPTSEPEIRAAVEFITSHPNITGGVAFHTFSGVLLRPYGTHADDTLPAEDLWTFQTIGAKGKAITGYPDISVFHDFKYHPKEVITGVFDDWLYDHLGVYAWTVEIWSPQRQAGITDYKYIDWFREHPDADELKLMKWNDEKLGGKGWVAWQPFDHPQLGPVEVGGWDNRHCFRNPPPEMLEKEVALFPDWLLWQALISPRLTLHSFAAAPLSEGVWRLRLVVDNEGWLPSYVSKKALERKACRGAIAELELPDGAALQTGKTRTDLGQLEGRAYQSAAGFGWVADTTSHRAKAEWVVSGLPGQTVRVKARHDRAGVVRAEVVLA
jgi:murein tripeptide amidase MpaA